MPIQCEFTQTFLKPIFFFPSYRKIYDLKNYQNNHVLIFLAQYTNQKFVDIQDCPVKLIFKKTYLEDFAYLRRSDVEYQQEKFGHYFH